MSIKRYLLIAFGSILIVGVLLGSLSIYTSASLQAESSRVIYAQKQLRLLKKIKSTTNRMLKEISDYILLLNAEEHEEFLKAEKSLQDSLLTLQNLTNKEMENVKDTNRDEAKEKRKELNVSTEIYTQFALIIHKANQAISYAQNGNKNEAIRLLEEEIEALYDGKLHDLISNQIDAEQEKINGVYTSLTDTFNAFQIQGITSMTLLLATVFFATLLAYRSIYRPISGLVNAVVRIGKGDYSVEIQQSDGEIGLLAESLQQMAHDLAKKQAQLVQSAKLASIGQLSSGIAHEVNRPLTDISMNAQTMRREISILENSYGLKDSARQIEKDAAQINLVINHLKKFSLQTDLTKQPLNVNQIVESSFTLLKEQFDSQNIELVTNYHNQLPRIMGNENELEQVLLHMMTNARDAIIARYDLLHGKIEISTDFNPQEKVVEIRLRDNGSGIDPEDIPFIFDPFYSTKNKDTHSGLGLSTVYGIIHQHGGTVSLTKTSREGSVFKIKTPVAET
jgi:signal transduction histidine kinase